MFIESKTKLFRISRDHINAIQFTDSKYSSCQKEKANPVFNLIISLLLISGM